MDLVLYVRLTEKYINSGTKAPHIHQKPHVHTKAPHVHQKPHTHTKAPHIHKNIHVHTTVSSTNTTKITTETSSTSSTTTNTTLTKIKTSTAFPGKTLQFESFQIQKAKHFKLTIQKCP